MSVDEAMLTGRSHRSRDGTVLPPTLTSRRCRQATVSVVDMSLAMECDYGLGLPRHYRCYDDQTSTRHRAKRQRRRHHDVSDDVEHMDTLDHPMRYLHQETDDVSIPHTDTGRWSRPVIVHNSMNSDLTTSRHRPVTDSHYDMSQPQPKWTSSRYLQTHADRHRRRAAARSRHKVITRHHSPSHADDFTRRTSSSPVCHIVIPRLLFQFVV